MFVLFSVRGGFCIFLLVKMGAHSDVVEALKAENAALVQRLNVLQFQLSQMQRLVFGVKSERFVPGGTIDQLPLFEGAPLEAEMPAPADTVIAHRRQKRKPKRQELPSHLPRVEIVIEPDVDVTGLRKIGEEVTETLDYKQAELRVIRRVRPKYVDPADEERGVIIAALPARPIEKGMAEPGLLAHVLIEKYVDHLPIYRQVQRFKRQGIDLSTSTLGGWIAASADLLEPIYEALKAQVLASRYIQADETPIKVQDPANKGSTHRGYYWVYHAPVDGLVLMEYQPGRSGRTGPGQMLQSYRGALQSDGYSGYDALGQAPDIAACGCWAHARRYFFEAKENDPERAEHALKEIAGLYEIESSLRETDPSSENRRRVRQQRAIPILERFKTWLEKNPGLPKSPWGQAVFYALARWDKLCRYTEDGRIEIDNNLVENAIRPIAIGRKNYLFAGSHEAAQRAAVIYSLLVTCKKNDVHPHLWLTDVLTRIPTHPHKLVAELLPQNWKNRNV